MKTGKVWGETECLEFTPFAELHRLSIRPNSKCSLHAHKHKWNGFLVISGTLYIEAHKNSYDLVDITELRPGQYTRLPPGEYHRFFTKDEAVEAIELYFPETLSEDIIRKDVGSSGV